MISKCITERIPGKENETKDCQYQIRDDIIERTIILFFFMLSPIQFQCY
jgi:hypothetical protein